jgi:hypothetical protein
MSAVQRPRVLSHEDAARVLQAAMARSAWDRLVVGLMLVTGWHVSKVAGALRRLGVTR